MKRFTYVRLAVALLSFFLIAVSGPFASAQNSTVSQITGTVFDPQKRPMTDAEVRLSGAASKTTTTAVDGSFTFLNLPSGVYRLDISKSGFDSATQADIVTAPGSTTNLGFTLQSASLTSLTIIGNVSVTARDAANSINTSPASVIDVPASTFAYQGQLSVNQVLNEEPGITIGDYSSPEGDAAGETSASPLQTGIPSIRGGLPYETESLIDGHAISLGQYGFFSPSFISPYLLQNVEVVKGPGATSPSVNYAINETVNYRTLEPTLKPEESVDFGEDQYGGNFANFRITGGLPGDRLSYAFDYVTQGTQGFERGLTAAGWFVPDGTAYVNGSKICEYGGLTFTGGPANDYGSFEAYNPMLICCPTFPANSNERNELGKLRYAFTPSTTLTVTWLGGQTSGVFQGSNLWNWNGTFTFAPPADYTGSLPAGNRNLMFDVGGAYGSPALLMENTNLFETEFHTPLGKTATLLLRQYSSSIQTFKAAPATQGRLLPPLYSYTTGVYGGVYFCTDPSCSTSTEQTFNGQVATLSSNAYYEYRSYNDLNGYTAEIDKQAGNDLLSLSYDEERTSTLQTQICSYSAPFQVTVPAGSSQSFQSVMGRAQFELGQRTNGTISDNFGSYNDVYSQDGGVTFLSSTHTYEAPRLSLTWRPNANQSVRASIGTSIAPPYIALLNNNALVSATTAPPVFYEKTANSGDVLPETAFGFDVGLDTRLHSPFTVLSVDAYQTLLHNQFLTTTELQGSYTCPPSGLFPGHTAPLYVTKTANLGHSEYEGVDCLHRTPPTGWGYRIQGSLQRAFVYDLPAGFYDTPSGPNTTNLSVFPNVNFSGGGLLGGLNGTNIPYSMGYSEINYRGRNGAYFLAGITYYGPHNAYNNPAFGVVTVSFDQPLTKRVSLQLSIYNLTNAYPSIYQEYGVTPLQTPLVNGQVEYSDQNVVGPSTARLTLHLDL